MILVVGATGLVGSDVCLSGASFGDVAEMCVLALENPAAERRTIEFGDPEPTQSAAGCRDL